jgi:hypothetical protein
LGNISPKGYEKLWKFEKAAQDKYLQLQFRSLDLQENIVLCNQLLLHQQRKIQGMHTGGELVIDELVKRN